MAAILAGTPGNVNAQSGACLLENTVLTCSGEWPDGIILVVNANTPPITALEMNGITTDVDVSNQYGVWMFNQVGGMVRVEAGAPGDTFGINTSGDGAYGLVAQSVGGPAAYVPIASLGIYIPVGPAGVGGAVSVENYADIVTGGNGAYGIVAENDVGTYPQVVLDSLESFDPNSVNYDVVLVEGDAANIGQATAGSNGGTFTINADGSYTFDPGTDFDNLVLAPAQEIRTEIGYYVNANLAPLSDGVIAVVYFFNEETELVDSRVVVEFSQFGIGGVDGDNSVLPDLQDFVDALLADAGVAGTGEAILVNNQGTVTTAGDGAHGVAATTVSGTGRAGKDSCTFCSSPSAGGDGANGGTIAVNNDGAIVTGGDGAAGIVAASRGGTGGQGGYGGPWYYGRAGGAGGSGGDVFVTGDGSIVTGGDGSSGIVVTSEGGVGGNGGSGSGATGGGNGGLGGDAGNVFVDSDTDITTAGIESHGIWGRSIGGSGGAGGSNGWLGTASGGSGGGASDGGQVMIRNGGIVTTSEDFSYGLFGQSVGGFGGNGGNASGLFVSWGGHGRSAGSGGTVSILNDITGSIFTEGAYSHAIVGQSIGGGGGSGGSGTAIAGIGGAAGAGGHGGPVDIVNLGVIDTDGFSANGIYAQSVGGGGGDGGDAGGLGAVGGDGSVASDGGVVDVENAGGITTRGDQSQGIFMQSVGGGGGSGGDSGALFVSIGGTGNGGGEGGDLYLNNGGLISTEGDRADGVFMQTIGGGGGNGGASGGAVSLGGSGAGGGNAGELMATNAGSIFTLGDFSNGIFAQAIGGGGGNGNASGGYFASIGGTGGGAGIGGLIDILNSGDIVTAGLAADGIFAQSIGGGGGNGGGSGAWFASLGGDGGTAGNGGAVTVGNTGMIATSGFAAQSIFAQSIGGGGGNGAGTGAFFASIGGDGAAAGNGGAVSVDNSGMLFTEDDISMGIFAQSIGGGGGSGAGTGAWFASLGGQGGAGGTGGVLDILNSGQIVTSGIGSHSIFAQSIGGGGGSGGGSGGVWVAIGGDGGIGSHGGDITVNNIGELVTSGFGARGIHAESIGGGGGTGAGSGALNIAIGGDGGAGSNGGTVFVDNAGFVTTYGDLAHSVYAVSIGGGGGSASSVGSAFLTFGGDGASGGDGGLVTVNNSNELATFGDASTGIFAQSVGGGGGNGGSATTVAAGPNFSLGVAVGGDGGDGGIGQLVTIDNSGSIFTEGANSHGIFVQSVGGGGGAGGNAFSFSGTAPVIPEIPVAINASVAIGGNGGDGGDGGVIDINHSGDILTTGFRASGITAQSIGGGGGDGGNATSVTLNINVDASGTVAIGGDGGLGGDGNLVDVDSTGTIMTEGAHASGIIAQSVGGGGGAGGNSTTVKIDIGFPTSPEDLVPTPSGSMNVSIGGTGGGGGDGGDVTVTSDDAIVTEGVFAAGIMAQSIGGGGGVGGDARTYEFNVSANPTDFVPYLDIMSFDSTLIFGGDGGAGGDGGNVLVTNNAGIYTQGAFGYGVVAQSVGGGGGSGGNAITFEIDTTDLPIPDVPILDDITGLTNLSMVLEGGGGDAGDGGNIALTNGGDIITEGDFAHGVVAQSVAGGGGLAGIANAQGTTTSQMGEFAQGILSLVDGSGIGFAGSVGGAGTAGNVMLTNTGNIITLGDSAFGLFAQSAAGLGSAGTVNVTSSGDIIAQGLDSFGIVAQSVGGAGNGNIVVNIMDGNVVGGSGIGAGVLMSDGAVNSLTNNGLIGSAPGVFGIAITSTGGDEVVESFGTVIGSVDLGAGTNAFNNYGWLDTGATMFIGNGNLLWNDGTLSTGGGTNVLVTNVTGNFVQTSAGTLVHDVQFNYGADLTDRLNVTGTTVLDGVLALNLMDTGRVMPGTYEHLLVASSGGITDSGITLQVAPSAVVSYELFAQSDNEHALRYAVDFAPSHMHRNYMAIGDYINRIQLAGGTAMMEPLTAALVAQPDVGMLKAAYDRLSPHAYWANQATRVYSSMSFDQSLHSCPVREGDYRFSRQGECTWMAVADRSVQHEARDGTLASNEDATVVSLGFQQALTAHWHGALAFGYEHNSMTIPTFTERDGKQFQVGGIFKGRYGPNSLSFSGSIGQGTFDTRRYVMLPTPDVIVDGSRDIKLAGLHTRYAFDLTGDAWYIRPSVDLGYTSVDVEGIQETDAGPANLTIEGRRYEYVTARGALEVGGEWVAGGNTLFRPFARAGITSFLSGETPDINATLGGAPAGVLPFTQWTELDKNYTDAAVGFDVLWSNGFTLRLGYEGQYGSAWQADTWYAKFLYEF